MRDKPATLNTMRRDSEAGTTLIEISLMSVIFTIALIAIATAIRTAVKGTLMSREQTRAMMLARDQLENVKNMGFKALVGRFSNYPYPDRFDSAMPMYQKKDAVPYPTDYTPNAVEDPWTAEDILVGGIRYWRHVVVKFVIERGDGVLIQNPPPDLTATPPVFGGHNSGSGLAFIEVDVTWYNRRTGRMSQVRVTSLLADTSVSNRAQGQINGRVIDDGAGTGAPVGPLPIPLGADDSVITTGLVVTAENAVTHDVYTVKSDTSGDYHFGDLPDGTYSVRVSGAPAYQNSEYTSFNKGLYAATGKSVEINDTSLTLNNVDIYAIKVKKVIVKAKIDAGAGSQTVVVSMNDGVSLPSQTTVDCAPCEVTLTDVAVPGLGNRKYLLRIENKTTPGVAGATLCIDSSTAEGSIWYVGWGGILPFGGNPCAGGCAGFGGGTCVDPIATGPALTFTTTGMTTADVGLRVKVQECANFSCGPPTAPGLVRVSYFGKTTGLGATLIVDADGIATFTGVPPERARDLVVTAQMTVTGHSYDQYEVPVDLLSGMNYDLDENNGSKYSAVPTVDNRHNFQLIQVSAISGTVFKGDGTGFGGAVVRIARTEWSTVVTANDSGQFKYANVPVATGTYTVAPVVGADFSSQPVSLTVAVSAKGTEYRIGNVSSPPAFTVVPINGKLWGYVSYAGERLKTGAVVVACTIPCLSPFPDTLPDPALLNHSTYSTVTLTDGRYSLDVVAGLRYCIYSYVVRDGNAHVFTSDPADVLVPAGTDTRYDITIP